MKTGSMQMHAGWRTVPLLGRPCCLLPSAALFTRLYLYGWCWCKQRTQQSDRGGGGWWMHSMCLSLDRDTTTRSLSLWAGRLATPHICIQQGGGENKPNLSELFRTNQFPSYPFHMNPPFLSCLHVQISYTLLAWSILMCTVHPNWRNVLKVSIVSNNTVHIPYICAAREYDLIFLELIWTC